MSEEQAPGVDTEAVIHIAFDDDTPPVDIYINRISFDDLVMLEDMADEANRANVSTRQMRDFLSRTVVGFDPRSSVRQNTVRLLRGISEALRGGGNPT